MRQPRETRQPERYPMLERYALLLANQERLRLLGEYSQLVWHPAAALAARQHSRDQLTRGYMGHHSPEGEDVAARLTRLKVPYQLAGENIARVQGGARPQWEVVARMHRGLMDSEQHRANLLEQGFRGLGVGIAAGAGQVILTQVFVTERRWNR